MKVNLNRRGLFFSVIGVIGVSIAVYVAAPIIIDGPWPQRSSAMKFFDQHHGGLEALYAQLNEDGLSSVICYPDSAITGTRPRDPGQALRDESLTTYMALCSEAGIALGSRTENGFLFYLGGAGNDAFDFNIALIRLDAEPTDVPDCVPVSPSGDIGKCQFKLNSVWRLDYEWYSKEYLESFSGPDG